MAPKSPPILLHFLIHNDVLMLRGKFELILTKTFEVIVIVKNWPISVYASEKIIKMENSLLAIFNEIWPMTLYYIVQGLWPNFGANLKICKKFSFDWNQLKFFIQHKYMYMHQKKL